jgi:hypothetical protein
VPPVIAFVNRHRARFFLVSKNLLFPDFKGNSVIRVTVGWLGRGGGGGEVVIGLFQPVGQSQSAILSCASPPLFFCTIQNLWFCRWSISESCFAKLDFPSCMFFKILVEKEINRSRKFDLSVSSFLEWVKKSHPPGPPATILK